MPPMAMPTKLLATNRLLRTITPSTWLPRARSSSIAIINPGRSGELASKLPSTRTSAITRRMSLLLRFWSKMWMSYPGAPLAACRRKKYRTRIFRINADLKLAFIKKSAKISAQSVRVPYGFQQPLRQAASRVVEYVTRPIGAPQRQGSLSFRPAGLPRQILLLTFFVQGVILK